MRPSGDIEAVLKYKNKSAFQEGTRTMINGNIELNCAYLGQLPPIVMDSHRNIVKFDGSIVITDANSRLNATLVRPGQAQGSEQY